MSLGIEVLGAASMGALRAAEPHSFGMVGVGRAFELACAGELTADDEVAVAHLGPEHAHRAVSEALVSVRASVDDAVSLRIITEGAGATVVAVARQLHYAERRWPDILAGALDAGVERTTIERLRAWLVTGRRDVKADAASLLDELARRLVDDAAAPSPTFHFEATEQWRAVAPVEGSGSPLDRRVLDDLLDGLRLDGREAEVLQGGLLGVLARRCAELDATMPSGLDLDTWVAQVRSRVAQGDLGDLDGDGLRCLAADQAALARGMGPPWPGGDFRGVGRPSRQGRVRQPVPRCRGGRSGLRGTGGC